MSYKTTPTDLGLKNGGTVEEIIPDYSVMTEIEVEKDEDVVFVNPTVDHPSEKGPYGVATTMAFNTARQKLEKREKNIHRAGNMVRNFCKPACTFSTVLTGLGVGHVAPIVAAGTFGLGVLNETIVHFKTKKIDKSKQALDDIESKTDLPTEEKKKSFKRLINLAHDIHRWQDAKHASHATLIFFMVEEIPGYKWIQLGIDSLRETTFFDDLSEKTYPHRKKLADMVGLGKVLFKPKTEEETCLCEALHDIADKSELAVLFKDNPTPHKPQHKHYHN